MQIAFALPHVFNSTSTSKENARALQALLDCLVNLNMAYLQDMKEKGHFVMPLYKAGVTYGRTTVWDTIPALYARGYGDCKSLSCALVAQWRARGIKCRPVHRWMKRPDGSGATDFHILVQTANGWEDPSKKLGMGQNENARIQGPNWK